MSTQPPGSAPENFSVEYQEKNGGAYNADLKGSGTLTLSPAEGTCVFAGKQRRMFGTPVELTIPFGQIVNVVVRGRRVEFDRRSDAGRSVAKPFVFFGESAEIAADIGRRLPAERDEEFLAEEDFAAKLRSLPAARQAWSSPTNVIIGANFVVFAIMGVLGAGWLETADMMVYVRYGANNGAVTTNGEWWRLVSSMFLHYGLLHLLFNMWALFQAGHLVERLLGSGMYVLAYFGSGIAGSLATVIWNGDKVWSAGASGAVFGVFGMLVGYIVRERHAIPRSVLQPLLKSTLWFAGYNLFFGFVHPGIDNAAHLGGLVGGLILAAVMARPMDLRERARLRDRRVLMGLATLVTMVTIGVAASPRFNYDWQEKAAWEEAIKEPLRREEVIFERQKAALAAFQSASGTNAEFIRWVAEEAVPFYQQWARELEAMALTPGKDTALRRDLLAGRMRAKIENYRQLIADVQAGDPDAAGRYYEAEKRAAERAGAGLVTAQ